MAEKEGGNSVRGGQVVPGLQTGWALASTEGKQVRLLESEEPAEFNVTVRTQRHVGTAQMSPPVRTRVGRGGETSLRRVDVALVSTWWRRLIRRQLRKVSSEVFFKSFISHAMRNLLFKLQYPVFFVCF